MIYSALEVVGGAAAAGVFKITHEVTVAAVVEVLGCCPSQHEVCFCEVFFVFQRCFMESRTCDMELSRWRHCLKDKEKMSKPEGSAPNPIGGSATVSLC